MAAVVLIGHGAEQGGDDAVKRRLQRRALQDRLERHQAGNADGEHEDSDQGRRGDGERRDDLVLLRTGLGADNVPRIDGARNFHVDQVAGDKREVSAAGPEHRRVDEVLGYAGDHPDDADGQKALSKGAHVRHAAEIGSNDKRRAQQQNQRHKARNAADDMRPVGILFKGFIRSACGFRFGIV